MIKNNKKFLLNLGVKPKLLDNIGDKLTKTLCSYAMDHVKVNNIAQLLTQLAFMELGGKHGAAMLAAEEIATVEQLKSLTKEQIEQVIADYELSHDSQIAQKLVKKMVIINQQEKLYNHSGGLKGEYYIDPQDEEDDSTTSLNRL